MADRFQNTSGGANAPAIAAFAITPSDSTDLAEPVRQVTLNAGGTLRWTGRDGAVNTTAALPAGSYALSAVRIHATGTSATGITGWV
ncbi:hypothetical protein [Neotabrizicola sp. sgz301269]|uniref:spike base protein, RCAP_Rcc01079 family n=1 Tax=Neotabrizicola sp. sgz301269 TaxID=3276282 RepID=UPI00376FDB9D